MRNGVWVHDALLVIILLNSTLLCSGIHVQTGLFLGQYSFSIGELHVRSEGQVQAFVHFNITNDSLIKPSDKIILRGMALQNNSWTYYIGDLSSKRSPDKHNMTSYLLTDLQLETNYTIDIVSVRNNSLLISDPVNLLTTSLQRITVEPTGDGVFHVDCHFLLNTRTEGCDVCWIPIVKRGRQEDDRVCQSLTRGENGTAAVVNGTIDGLQAQTTYRVEAFGVNNGEVLHPFPILLDEDIMTITTANSDLGMFFMNTWFIVGFTTLLIALLVACIVISIGIIILCNKRNKRKKRRTTRKSTNRDEEEVIITRRNTCYNNHTLNTTEDEPPHYYEDVDLELTPQEGEPPHAYEDIDRIAKEPAYDNVTLDEEQIADSPIESPTLVPGPILRTQEDNDVDNTAVETYMTMTPPPLRKPTWLPSYPSTSRANTLKPGPVSRDLLRPTRRQSTFVKQMCEQIERGDLPLRMSCKRSSTKARSTSPVRSQPRVLRSQTECCDSNSKWPKGFNRKPSNNVVKHASIKTTKHVAACSSMKSSRSPIALTEPSRKATSTLSLTSDLKPSTSSPCGINASNHLQLPSSRSNMADNMRRKASTLQVHCSAPDQQPRDYEVAVPYKSLPGNMQPV